MALLTCWRLPLLLPLLLLPLLLLPLLRACWLLPPTSAARGEDMIVSSAALRDKRPASALTYVEIVCLTRANLEVELGSYPLSSHHIHVAAVNFGARRRLRAAPTPLAPPPGTTPKRIHLFSSTQTRSLLCPLPPSTAMMRAPLLIANYLHRNKKSTKDLIQAMKRLGTATGPQDKELQSMLKQINGSRPLRSFARELIHDGDDTLARRSMTAVEVMGGDQAKMLVDENGQVITETVCTACSLNSATMHHSPGTHLALRIDRLRLSHAASCHACTAGRSS